jgi:hypothetical protein
MGRHRKIVTPEQALAEHEKVLARKREYERRRYAMKKEHEKDERERIYEMYQKGQLVEVNKTQDCKS